MAGIVHFANFHRYMEAAEHAWFRSLKLKISGELPDGRSYGWPRVSAACSYHSPARYDEVICIDVSLVHRGSRSLTTTYEFTRDGQLLARGEMKTVFCVIEPGQPLHSANIPDDIAAILDRAVTSSAP